MTQTLCCASIAEGLKRNEGPIYEAFPPNPPNDGILFVDHSPDGRSGHLGHALVEYANGNILAFYPNCSNDNKGHSAVGWMEYKRSRDGGKTWSDPEALSYSKQLFESGQNSGPEREKFSAFAEKAVLTDDGDIVLFCLICYITTDTVWRRFQIPTYIISKDQGHTWSEPHTVVNERGRVYDARYVDGEILALFFANDNEINFLGNKPEHVYELYVSEDGGRSFTKRSQLPFDTKGKSYGTMEQLESGTLVAYIYNRNDEFNMDYVQSNNGGRTWSEVKTSHFSKKIRNPQMTRMNGSYFLYGRSGSLGKEKGHMVLYSSSDGLHWDGGTYLRMREHGLGAYSNGLVVGAKNPDRKNRLLIQASHAYELSNTSVLHWWIDSQ